MPKSVCPHGGIPAIAIMKPPPVQVVDLDEDDDEEESMDGDDYGGHYEDHLASVASVEAIKSAHSGRVKTLAKMFDKFAEKLQTSRVPAPQRKFSWNGGTTGGTSTGHTLKQDIKDNAGPSSSSSTSKQVEGIPEAPTDANERLELLEEKMDAMVTFVKGLFTHNLETLGKSYIEDVRNHKESTVVKAKIDSFDEELDEVQANYEDVHMLVQNSKKEIAKVKRAVVKLTHFSTKEIQVLTQTLCTILRKLDNFNEINLANNEKLKMVLDKLQKITDARGGQGDDKEKIKNLRRTEAAGEDDDDLDFY